MRIVDLFAGPGGWDEGLAQLGVRDVVGVEWDQSACATAMAAGHLRVRADVSAYPVEAFEGVQGLLASPPCQAFSTAGKGLGLDAVDELVAHLWACRHGWSEPPAAICGDDVRADLTLQPARWVDALRPEWVACEQVPAVLPLWQAFADVLRHWGYSAVTAIVNAADYGVPQTRRRAVLLASRVRDVRLPEVTHTDPRKGGSLFLEPWVSMAEALGWGAGMAVDRRTNSRGPGGTVVPTVSVPTDRPAPTFTQKSGGQWQVGWGFVERPAPTVCAGENGKYTGAEWGGSAIRGVMYDAQDTPAWVHKRPATTTVVGSFNPDVIAAPGYRTTISRQNAPDSIRVSVREAGVLQSFRPDYPWQGSKTKQYEQVGNAVPVRLAQVLCAQLVHGPHM